MRIMNFWDSPKLFWQSTFNSTYDESLKFQLQQNMGERECHPTFCCWIIAQNRTWYVRDKSRCGSTWQVIWTNVSSIPRTRGSRSPDDVNLLLAHSHRFVLSWSCSQQTTTAKRGIRLPCVVLEKDHEKLYRNRWFLLKKTKRNTFGMIYGRERVNIFVSHELKFPKTFSIGEKINLQKGVELKF